MPKLTYKTCRECGRHAREAGVMSHTRLCNDCGVRIKIEAVTQIHDHDGPWFDHWRQRMAACVGAVIPERVDANTEER